MGEFRIKISAGENLFEVEGDEKFVREMFAKYTEGDQKLKKIEKTKIEDNNIKRLSVGEFIRQFDFKKHTDYVLAFGYYMEVHSEANNFTPADINTCYYDAKMETSNTSQMIIQNIKRGYMMEAKKEKDRTKVSYVLTKSGIEFIQNSFKAK